MNFTLICGKLNGMSLAGLALTVIILIVSSLYLIIYAFSHNPRAALPEEDTFIVSIDSNGHEVKQDVTKVTKDNIDSTGDVLLSVVVPSYNETKRIETMLTEAVEHLQKSFPNQWEIIIVDDGSSDGTTKFCLDLSKEKFNLKNNELKVIKLAKNRGKGGAVRHGLLRIQGKYGLFADADGASKFSDASKLIESIQEQETQDIKDNSPKAAIAIGSRAHMVNTEAVVKRSFLRNTLMYGFHALVYLFGIRSIKDTQCGFKLFNRQSIHEILPYLHTEGWIFDVEILMLGIRKGISIVEVPVSWHEVDGSKVDLARDSINMAIDLVVIRMAYLLGVYNDSKEC
ncbi:hypothetical protein TPHA_0E02660 [Tetrapisispora phaffii CBS 4417]|uniref:dolichyl-phosphate beta-glucosyltransferase n=1 Tax=Tetrapisispora phaffii (strain ATCC 24235 / CBS 4417 / NBRC 1672 / NRRL Y-8282 / UCD 70-5) TaxID=1071381 RepID=G8BTY0_TETPH|nr:hypothetical protein TPHA_0E02660 [Tetrapisispora phaffii CBS 4417]CCE63358.1 hypothetical protein TPHA_0E02660 [Tetrapisispora phaffii CBS 4417]